MTNFTGTHETELTEQVRIELRTANLCQSLAWVNDDWVYDAEIHKANAERLIKTMSNEQV